MGHMNGIIRINTYYINTYFMTAIISNICSDPRCDSGEDGGPALFSKDDYAYSKGNGNRRRLLCLVCAHHQFYVTDEEMIPLLHEVQGMKH